MPIDWRIRYALATCLFLRGGELQALRWEDVDTERGIVTVRLSFDQEAGIVKQTKTGNREVLNELSLSPAVVRQAVEAANTTCSERESALKETEQALKARAAALSSPIGNLVEVLKTSGAAALAEVSKELERLTGEAHRVLGARSTAGL